MPPSRRSGASKDVACLKDDANTIDPRSKQPLIAIKFFGNWTRNHCPATKTISVIIGKEAVLKRQLILLTIFIYAALIVGGAMAQGGKQLKTPSGLVVDFLQEGKGPLPAKGQTVLVHYTGTLLNGQKFDSSRDRGQPFSFVLGQGQVIKGWDEGLALMKVGSRAKLTIPPELGYGARGAGGIIPPNSVLVFDVELLDAK